MSPFEQIAPLATVVVAFATVVFTTLMMARQVRQMEQERNALALLGAIDRMASEEMVRVFNELRGVNERYPSDDDLAKYPGSDDERALMMVGQYIETVATLARREVLDASLIVDAHGFALRSRWAAIKPFVERLRRHYGNEFLFENYEWLAKYSNWWKDIPRPKHPNYSEHQFD